MLKYLIEKEFKQFKRNAFLPKLVVFMPCLMLLILPWAADLETKNVNISVVDNDHSVFSSRLVNKALSSGYFNLVDVSSSYSQSMESIEHGDADIILEIPRGFEYNFVKEKMSKLMISVNTVNGTKGMIGSSYLSMSVKSFMEELYAEMGISVTNLPTTEIPVIQVETRSRFNSGMAYKPFMIPALMVMLITLIAGFLPALNIVSEKEIGTIEQINVTPVKKLTFILSKLIPYWIIGFVVLSLCFSIAFLVYGLVPHGSLWTLYVASFVYVLAISGFGLVISNYSTAMQQAMFVMFFFLIIFMLMSGLFTPVRSMPDWAQKITIFNPLKYFIEIMRSVYLKGSKLSELSIQIGALCCFAFISNIWAILSYKKSR
ncbi:MAG: ABC transporter permease [Prevotellaceae bacterium]|nr:ABC transporter permease [Prevotellaceae bacterium]